MIAKPLARAEVSMPPRVPGEAAGRDARASSPDQEILEQEFKAMRVGYQPTGGFACGDHVVHLMRERAVGQPVSVLARSIVLRQVVSFEWRHERLIPLFQFDASGMSVGAATARIIRELVDVFDDWELALWFAQSNSWLHDEVPADLIRRDPAAVLRAARTDRYIARG